MIEVNDTVYNVAIDAFEDTQTIFIEVGEGLTDAPIDGQIYGRKDATWEVVTGGGGATSADDITETATRVFVTPSEKTKLNNQSGTNTGDETTISIQTKRPIKTIENQSLEGTGNIDLSKSDVGLANVDDTSDANKPISTATQTALSLKANQDGTILYHSTKWFTPTSTVSNVGATVTSVGTQFTSGMVGSELTINNEQRIITAFTSSTVVTVNSTYSTNYSGVDAANWGVYSKAYEILSGFSRFIDSVGTLVFRTAAGNNIEIANGLQSGTSVGFFATIFTFRSDYLFTFSSTSSAFGTKDLGFRRNSAGILEIYDGVTATGLLANRRDLLVRNVNASQYNITALNTAPASATATGTTGEIRITADFIYVCTATNTWVRTALTTW